MNQVSKDTILIVGHGSREDSGNQEIREFTEQWRARRPDWRIELCFIEFAPPEMNAALLSAARSSRRVLVVPLILNAAGHVKMEIPEAIEQARLACPQTEILLAPHLTACDPILAILKRRLRKAMNALDMPDPTTTGVVVLGRGSSDRGANGEMAKMARWLLEEGDHELVDLAFTGITWPRLEKVVQRHVLLGMRQIVVLPYYLYTGTLMQRIHRQVEHLRGQYPQVRFACSEHFGFEKEIFELMDQRVEDLRAGVPDSRLPCDGCTYRVIAHDLGHGHSHAHTHDHAPHDHASGQEHAHEDHAHAHGDHAHDHDHDHAHHDHAHDHDHGHDHPHAKPESHPA
ncbi:sirohydrochlorin chelatase [Duganella dendranthematis]|jgi:sirohydrochlorin cobaltochelatase|uniref:Sirohydrochlorin chelatase n=1 Tax=Duganella dendranthematis TaxID=2728021 RepID=A0ABX6M7T0_9BURK|nr:sirohydrochlorin chelatase [Duganella dendranthematis]QJD90381.1 sirohydrochlorin chelatase [Duganella dendranthematis]